MSWFKGFDGLSLDFKLGGRMLVKYPGLTIVGGLAMAFAICVGAVVFAVLKPLVHPTLPLPAADRIVQIRNWDVAANRAEPRALHDFVAWRGALRFSSVQKACERTSPLCTNDLRFREVGELGDERIRHA